MDRAKSNNHSSRRSDIMLFDCMILRSIVNSIDCTLLLWKLHAARFEAALCSKGNKKAIGVIPSARHDIIFKLQILTVKVLLDAVKIILRLIFPI